VSPLRVKGTLPWRVDVYRVNTRRDRRRDGRANDHLVCSPYYPLHNGWAAQIKGRCVDNAVGLDSQRRCVWQPEVQRKVDVLDGLTATKARGRCAGGTSVKSRETDPEMATRIDCRFLATSDPLQHTAIGQPYL